MQTTSELFQKLIDTTAHYPNGLHPVALNGCLTAAALMPDEIDHRQLLTALLGFNIGEENVNYAMLDQLVWETIDAISEDIFRYDYEPLLAQDENERPDPSRWMAGFNLAVALNEETWEQFNETHLDAGKQYAFLQCLGDAELAQTLFQIPPEDHKKFVSDSVPLLKEIVESIYDLYWQGEDESEFSTETLTAEALPEIPKEALKEMDDDELMGLILSLDDMLPRAAVDEAIERGRPLAKRLRAHLEDPTNWREETDQGRWWGLLHAIFILGSMQGEDATRGLLHAIQRMHTQHDNDLWDWIAGYWPVLFRNKRAEAAEDLAHICRDQSLDWHPRLTALECLTEASAAAGQEPLDHWLSDMARMVSDETNDWDFRIIASNLLLDFPRPENRPILEALAIEQQDREEVFHYSAEDIDECYQRSEDQPPWERFSDPLNFYDRENILKRLRRWLEEDELAEANDDFDLPVTTYVRENPKIGRNDPCPCGSGKKYKKCCLKKLH